MSRARDLANRTIASAALPKAGGAMTGAITTNSTFDGIDIATRDAVLTSTTTTAGAALPKAGGTMSGNITMADNSSIGIGDATERIVFDDGGDISVLGANLGVGTDAPSKLLHTKSLTTVDGWRHERNNGFGFQLVGDPDDGEVRFEVSDDTGGTPGEGPVEGSTVWSVFDNTTVANMKLAFVPDGGKVGIGTATPGRELDVVGSIKQSYDAAGWMQSLYNHHTSGYGMELGVGNNTSANSAFEVQTSNEATNLFYVRQNGSWSLPGSGSSDERLKENIIDATYGLTEVLQLQPREFTWKDNPLRSPIKHGFIAQEVQLIMPKMVTGDSHELEEGEKPDMGFDYLGMSAVLTKAVQELSAKNDALEVENTALKTRMDALEARVLALES